MVSPGTRASRSSRRLRRCGHARAWELPVGRGVTSGLPRVAGPGHGLGDVGQRREAVQAGCTALSDQRRGELLAPGLGPRAVHDPQQQRNSGAVLFPARGAVGLIGLALPSRVGRLSVPRSTSMNQRSSYGPCSSSPRRTAARSGLSHCRCPPRPSCGERRARRRPRAVPGAPRPPSQLQVSASAACRRWCARGGAVALPRLLVEQPGTGWGKLPGRRSVPASGPWPRRGRWDEPVAVQPGQDASGTRALASPPWRWWRQEAVWADRKRCASLEALAVRAGRPGPTDVAPAVAEASRWRRSAWGGGVEPIMQVRRNTTHRALIERRRVGKVQAVR